MNLVQLTKAYRNKNVLVTGHTGFKGSWLSIWLKMLGANVIGYSLTPPTNPNNFEACNMEERIIHVIGDVRDAVSLFDIFKEYKPEIVFHLAAQSIVRESYENPKLTFDTNIGGTVNVLEAVRLNSCVKAFVNITSDKCYENKEWVWGYRENDPMGGRDPYSASKGCCELVFSAYLNSYFSGLGSNQKNIGVASVRAGNVIGGGDWAKDRLIPDCVRALTTKKEIEVRNPGSIRPWQHVLEPLGGYLLVGALLLSKPSKYSCAWNFGPNDFSYLDVITVVSKFVNLWGDGRWQAPDNNREYRHEAGLLKLSCEKARSLLGWNSVLDINACLDLTVEWYKAYYEREPHYNAFQICKNQIDKYMKIAYSSGQKWCS